MILNTHIHGKNILDNYSKSSKLSVFGDDCSRTGDKFIFTHKIDWKNFVFLESLKLGIFGSG